MDPSDALKAMGQFWGAGAQAMVDAQRRMMGLPAESTGEAGAAQAAEGGFAQALAGAQAVAAAFAGGLDAKSDPVAAEVLTKIFDPRGWLAATGGMDEAMTRLAEGPRLADLWNAERKFAALFAAWTALRRSHFEHNTLMLGVWTKAAGLFAHGLREKAEAGQKLGSAREMMANWVEVANDALLEAQRSEAFLKSQRATLKASTDLRLAQQDIAEHYSAMFGYPGRAELDDAHKAIADLRREVRALSREARRRAAREEARP